jgi:hypothetical protein
MKRNRFWFSFVFGTSAAVRSPKILRAKLYLLHKEIRAFPDSEGKNGIHLIPERDDRIARGKRMIQR